MAKRKKRNSRELVSSAKPHGSVENLKRRPKTENYIKKRVDDRMRVGKERFLKIHKMEMVREINSIERGEVRPMLSTISHHPCQAKKSRARREYFGMIKAGKGKRKKGVKTKNRFTVRCR